jgi:hypothetical protein
VTDGGGLRIYLRRGWFATGGDEALALVLSVAGDRTRDDVCHIGGDPARRGLPVQDDFGNFLDTRSALSVERKTTKSRNGAQAPSQSVELVQVVCLAVNFDRQKNLLFSDVKFRWFQPAYRPFVRLALARLQQNAVQDAQLSSTVLADFIQLGPYRMLSVVPNGNVFQVTVQGPNTGQTQADIFRTTVLVINEGRDSEDEPWTENGRACLIPNILEPGDITWSGGISRGRSTHNRLVIEEFETWNPPGDGCSDPELAGHLVYADSYPYA